MSFAAYLAPFSEYPVLQQRVLLVLEQLPSAVQRDFLDDPRFGITIDHYKAAIGWLTGSIDDQFFERCVIHGTADGGG